MKKFGSLPENILVSVAFSMSKSFTMYGQRAGAIIGVSPSKAIIDEFVNVNQVTGRTRWSHVNPGAMKLMANVHSQQNYLLAIQKERVEYVALIANRVKVFLDEAAVAGLQVLPYRGGFFITIPAKNPDAICEYLIKQNIYLASLAKGVRVAACSIPQTKMKGLAAKIAEAMENTR